LGQLKAIFSHCDINNDNLVTDSEWFLFFHDIVDPFQKCDQDQNYLLTP